jgi:ribosomal protein S8
MLARGELQHLISSIKLAYIGHKETLVFRKKGTYGKVLDILVHNGLIKTYHELPTLLVIRLKVLRICPPVVGFTLPSACTSITGLQALTRLQRRIGGSAYCVITTDRGIMTSLNAISQSIGGKILFNII